jgi:hypothetical protein
MGLSGLLLIFSELRVQLLPVFLAMGEEAKSNLLGGLMLLLSGVIAGWAAWKKLQKAQEFPGLDATKEEINLLRLDSEHKWWALVEEAKPVVVFLVLLMAFVVLGWIVKSPATNGDAAEFAVSLFSLVSILVAIVALGQFAYMRKQADEIRKEMDERVKRVRDELDRELRDRLREVEKDLTLSMRAYIGDHILSLIKGKREEA